MDEKHVIRLGWDYGLIFEWVSEDGLPERTLPADLVEQIHGWNARMEELYGLLHEDVPPPVDAEAAAEVDAQLTRIQERIRELGHEVEGRGRWWLAGSGVTVRDVDSGRFPDHPSRLIRTTESGDLYAVLVPASADVQPPGPNPLEWVWTAPGDAGMLEALAHLVGGRRWDVAVVLLGRNAFMHVATRVRYRDRASAEYAFVGVDDAQVRWWLRGERD